MGSHERYKLDALWWSEHPIFIIPVWNKNKVKSPFWFSSTLLPLNTILVRLLSAWKTRRRWGDCRRSYGWQKPHQKDLRFIYDNGQRYKFWSCFSAFLNVPCFILVRHIPRISYMWYQSRVSPLPWCLLKLCHWRQKCHYWNFKFYLDFKNFFGH